MVTIFKIPPFFAHLDPIDVNTTLVRLICKMLPLGEY